MSGKQDDGDIASTIMDIYYYKEDTDVLPVVFTSGVGESRTNPAIGLEQVGFIRYRISASHEFPGNRTTIVS